MVKPVRGSCINKGSSINGYYGYDGSESKEFLSPKLVRSRRQLLENQNCLKLLIYFKLAIFSTHTPQILGSIFKLGEIINLIKASEISGNTANAHAIIQIRQESSTLSFNFVTDTIVNWHS